MCNGLEQELLNAILKVGFRTEVESGASWKDRAEFYNLFNFHFRL